MLPVASTVGAPLAWPPAILSSDDRLRFARYAEARDFFEGAQWLGRPRRGETRLTFNYARAVVRKTAPVFAYYVLAAGALGCAVVW